MMNWAPLSSSHLLIMIQLVMIYGRGLLIDLLIHWLSSHQILIDHVHSLSRSSLVRLNIRFTQIN